MSKGPKFNNVNYNFTSRDNLGIKSVASSLQDTLCPVVTNETTRAFYWIFMTWNYYDFLRSTEQKNWTYDRFNKPFLKKNDYYFVLASLLTPNSDKNGMAAKDNVYNDYLANKTGPFNYNDKYYVQPYGGMYYYGNGCTRMGFITNTDNDGNKFPFPRITEKTGVPIAKAFESIISKTRYFKEYRLLANPYIPKAVLEELGSTISLNLEGLDECKRLLKNALFEPVNNIRFNNKNLIASSEYLKMLYSQFNIKNPDTAKMREVLFDYFSPLGEYKYDYNKNLEDIIKGWEVIIGRSYFAIAIEIIWKQMMVILDTPMTKEKWFNECFERSKWDLKTDHLLSEIIDECNYNYSTRETMIYNGRHDSMNNGHNIENGIRLLISIYNRFKNRQDINTDMLFAGEDISIAELIKLINEYSEKTIKDFIMYIMNNWIIDRHRIVAYGKLADKRDGFYFEEVNNRFIQKAIPTPEFQGIRLISLLQIMKDLDMLEE